MKNGDWRFSTTYPIVETYHETYLRQHQKR